MAVSAAHRIGRAYFLHATRGTRGSTCHLRSACKVGRCAAEGRRAGHARMRAEACTSATDLSSQTKSSGFHDHGADCSLCSTLIPHDCSRDVRGAIFVPSGSCAHFVPSPPVAGEAGAAAAMSHPAQGMEQDRQRQRLGAYDCANFTHPPLPPRQHRCSRSGWAASSLQESPTTTAS